MKKFTQKIQANNNCRKDNQSLNVFLFYSNELNFFLYIVSHLGEAPRVSLEMDDQETIEFLLFKSLVVNVTFFLLT